MAEVLKATGLSQRFGGLVALENIEMNVQEGEIVGVIGPNGAGKTTLFNCITGIYYPTSGRVFMLGRDITGWKPHAINRLGFSRTFQNIRLFSKMTVLDNVITGMHSRTKTKVISAVLRLKSSRNELKEMEEKAGEILKIFGLYDLRFEIAVNLPYGPQRELEIARALAGSPKLLLLDEPAAGMNEQETARLGEIVLKLKEMGHTILLIEHDMRFVMNICERIYVLDDGRLIGQGTPMEVKSNPAVVEAYLGKDE
jgi:branched-chain amino acid transport system ATP-binding protein